MKNWKILVTLLVVLALFFVAFLSVQAAPKYNSCSCRANCLNGNCSASGICPCTCNCPGGNPSCGCGGSAQIS